MERVWVGVGVTLSLIFIGTSFFFFFFFFSIHETFPRLIFCHIQIKKKMKKKIEGDKAKDGILLYIDV